MSETLENQIKVRIYEGGTLELVFPRDITKGERDQARLLAGQMFTAYRNGILEHQGGTPWNSRS